MRASDASTSTSSRNRCLINCPSLQENKLDPELSAIQWLIEERLLSIHLDGDDRSRYWCDENEEEYLDALFNVV